MNVTRPLRRHLFSVLTAALVSSATACGEPEPVPFGLDRPAPGAEDRSAPVTPPTPAPSALTLASAAWPDGTRTLDVAAAHVVLTSDVVRASGALDLDGDDDLDALLVAIGDDRVPRLLWVAIDAGVAASPVEVAALPALAGGCAMTSARLEALGSSLVSASFDTQCENTNGPAASATSAWVLDVSGAPRVLERFGLRALGAGDALTFLELDRDADGHGDLVAQVRIGEETVSLVWRTMASGLAREPAEPEARIAELADAAREAVRRDAATATIAARTALALHSALCRESETARLDVGGRAGLECRPSAGAGRARAVMAAAAAHEGNVLLALAMLGDLERPDVTVRDVDRRLAEDALRAAGTATAWPAQDGPEAEGGADRDAPRLSSLAFDDETHLLVRTGEARVVDLETGAVTPAPDRAERRLLDPSGALELLGIERRCDGTVLVIAPSSGIVDPITGSRRIALIEPRPAPIGVPCPDLNDALRRDAHGFFALGWAPQGVLVARDAELSVVPLDVGGHLAGVVETLAPDAIAPAPIAAGHATRDVSAFARATPYGILLVTRSPATTTLVRPEGYTHEGSPIDVAVSPSARRLAWIGGGRVHWAAAPD